MDNETFKNFDFLYDEMFKKKKCKHRYEEREKRVYICSKCGSLKNHRVYVQGFIKHTN